MALDDLLTAVRVGDPQLSPDGRVLYVRTTTDISSGKRNSDIWMVRADGSAAPAPFIASPKSDDSPRFLADGRVAFISTRDGAPQVYVADAGGANIRAVTHLSAGVQPPLVISPDGTMVAFVSDVFPTCADEACNTRMREAIEKDPVNAHSLTRLPFRHWNEWWETGRHHVFVSDIESGATRDVTPGDFDAPPHNYEDGAIAFSADSRELAFVSKRGAKDTEMWTTNHNVWTVPASGGTAKKLTPNPAADMQPTYSPDGKWIVVRSQRRAGTRASGRIGRSVSTGGGIRDRCEVIAGCSDGSLPRLHQWNDAATHARERGVAWRRGPPTAGEPDGDGRRGRSRAVLDAQASRL